MKNIIVLLVILLSFAGHAQNEALFNRATTYYNEGEYEKASENYLKIIENGEHSAAVYYNLGNCYYKLNQIAPSIYYYENNFGKNPRQGQPPQRMQSTICSMLMQTTVLA